MALQMNYTKQGAVYPESYWRIGDLQINRRGNYADMLLHGYYNNAARQADVAKNVLEMKRLRVQGGDYESILVGTETLEEIYSALYGHAKSDAFFAEAVDA